jgi:hypothetical protein
MEAMALALALLCLCYLCHGFNNGIFWLSKKKKKTAFFAIQWDWARKDVNQTGQCTNLVMVLRIYMASTPEFVATHELLAVIKLDYLVLI